MNQWSVKIVGTSPHVSCDPKFFNQVIQVIQGASPKFWCATSGHLHLCHQRPRGINSKSPCVAQVFVLPRMEGMTHLHLYLLANKKVHQDWEMVILLYGGNLSTKTNFDWMPPQTNKRHSLHPLSPHLQFTAFSSCWPWIQHRSIIVPFLLIVSQKPGLKFPRIQKAFPCKEVSSTKALQVGSSIFWWLWCNWNSRCRLLKPCWPVTGGLSSPTHAVSSAHQSAMTMVPWTPACHWTSKISILLII